MKQFGYCISELSITNTLKDGEDSNGNFKAKSHHGEISYLLNGNH